MLTHFTARKRAEGYRLPERPRLCLCNHCHRDPARGCQHCAADETADSSLIGTHAMSRVALHVLGVFIALAACKPDIVGRDVVLQVYEGLAGTRHLPQGC